MAELFNITHDANNLNEYDSTVTDGGDLSTGTPGLADTTARMEALIDDTNVIYGKVNQAAPASNEIRFRFYVDPNGLAMADGNNFLMLYLELPGDPWSLSESRFFKSGADYKIGLYYYEDSGFAGSDSLVVSDAPHYVEIHVERASSNVAGDGRVRWWVDGNLEGTFASLDNFDIFATLVSVQMGAPGSLDAGTSGTIFFDELKANDDGSEIGPVSAAEAAMPMAMDLYRFRRV